jgi:RimJ/RimL family protein N-acetyltransferase
MTSVHWQPDNLENEIVQLIPLSEADWEGLFAVASDPLIWAQHPSFDRYKRDVFRSFFDEAIQGASAFLIKEKATQAIIGSTRYYDYNQKEASIAIGYTFLAKQYWGGVYNKATKQLLLNYAFQYLDTVCFHIGGNNIRSQLATTKIGAIKTKEFTTELNGEKVLKFEYAIEKKNWKNT